MIQMNCSSCKQSARVYDVENQSDSTSDLKTDIWYGQNCSQLESHASLLTKCSDSHTVLFPTGEGHFQSCPQQSPFRKPWWISTPEEAVPLMPTWPHRDACLKPLSVVSVSPCSNHSGLHSASLLSCENLTRCAATGS